MQVTSYDSGCVNNALTNTDSGWRNRVGGGRGGM